MTATIESVVAVEAAAEAVRTSTTSSSCDRQRGPRLGECG